MSDGTSSIVSVALVRRCALQRLVSTCLLHPSSVTVALVSYLFALIQDNPFACAQNPHQSALRLYGSIALALSTCEHDIKSKYYNGKL